MVSRFLILLIAGLGLFSLDAAEKKKGFLDERVSIEETGIDTVEAIHRILGEEALQNWLCGSAYLPMIDVKVENRPRCEALDVILRLAGGIYEWNWSPKNQELTINLTRQAKKREPEDPDRDSPLSRAHRIGIANKFPAAKTVMGFLLDFEMEQISETMFPIEAYGRYTQILDTKIFLPAKLHPF